MNLAKWKTKLNPKFPRVIEKLFGKNINEGGNHDESVGTIPAINVDNADTVYEISVVLPGVDKKDVQISIDNNLLTIKSEKQYSNEERDKNYMRKEFGYASFQRVFELPNDIDDEKIDAKIENGLLQIKVGKINGVSSKKVIELK